MPNENIKSVQNRFETLPAQTSVNKKFVINVHDY